MSEENVEVVRRIIDAINRRDVDAVVESGTKTSSWNLSTLAGF